MGLQTCYVVKTPMRLANTLVARVAPQSTGEKPPRQGEKL